MTSEDYKTAASFLRKYAEAVESHLYIHMKTDDAHFAIVDSLDLAELMEAEALRLHFATKSNA